MAVCRWLYANAKMEGDRKDYFVRICDSGLESCKGKLIELSNRLLSADKRRGRAEKQICWFAGYITEEIYMVVAGGGQENLLGISKGSYREQYCVLGYGFTGADICLLRKDDSMFEPLKEIMRRIQRTGTEEKDGTGKALIQDFSAYRLDAPKVEENFEKNGKMYVYNIRPSTEETDRILWRKSLFRPVMLGIISAEDGKRLLRCFPDGFVTVLEDIRLRYDAAAYKDKNPGSAGKKQTGDKSWQQGGKNPGAAGSPEKQQAEDRSRQQDGIKREQKPGPAAGNWQEQKKQKYLEQMRLVKYWADWCRDHLSAAQVKAVRQTAENMKAEQKWSGKGTVFFKQSEYSGYMLLWHDKKKRNKEQEIYFLMESWADTMTMKKNVQLAEMIKKINNRDTK